MAFPKKLLADHEKMVFDLKPHWVALLPASLWTVFWLAAWIVGYQVAERNMDDPGTVQNVVALVSLVGWYFFAILPFLRWRYTNFVLTSDRLITRQGIVAKHSKEIPLERINDVAFNQTVLERFLGAGDLMIESAGERGQTRIGNVRKPEQVQLMIYKESEANNIRMMRPDSEEPTGTAKLSGSVAQKLEELARLKEKGIISDIEYENKRADLLKRL